MTVAALIDRLFCPRCSRSRLAGDCLCRAPKPAPPATSPVFRRPDCAAHHWPKQEPHGRVAACGGWDLDAATPVDPATVPPAGRCKGEPCAQKWADWQTRQAQRSTGDFA